LRRVFSVELSNGKDLYGELELPASTYQLLDMLEQLNMKSGDLPEWEIGEYHCFEFLAPFLDSEINLYELNALCQKLGDLDDLQSAAFDGLLQMEINKREGHIGIDKLMSLVQNVDCCHVVDEALNDSQLGRFYAENGFIPEVEKVPDEIFELLDFELLGGKMRRGEGGVFTRKGYVVPHSGITQIPYTMPQPPQKPDYSFRLILNNYPFENEETHEWHNVRLSLPATEEEIAAALVQLGNPPWSGVVFGVEDSAIPELLDDVDCFDGLEQFNRLAIMVKRLEETGQLMKYKAVLQATGCTDLSMAEELAGRLDEYILDSSSRSVEDVALGELHTMMDKASVETLLPHLKLYSYGLDIMRHDNSELTPYGLVERGDGQPLQAQQPNRGGMEMM